MPDERRPIRACSAHHAIVGRLVDLWADPDTMKRWRAHVDCGADADAVDVLAALVATRPVTLDPARVHTIEMLMLRLWRSIVWWHTTRRLSVEEGDAWARVFETWRERDWSAHGRISA